jgi:predicted anti-sigma-YlaC factor YlaD
MTSPILTSTHLSEDDLDDFLLGLASSDASGHIADCSACRERVAAFESQMAVFNQASRDWSEARSNTISRDLAAHRPSLRLTQAAMWYSTAAAVLAVAFTLTTNLHRDAGLQTGTAQTETVAAATPEEIDADNAMLAAISSETATPRPARFGLYEGAKTEASTPRATIRQVKD